MEYLEYTWVSHDWCTYPRYTRYSRSRRSHSIYNPLLSADCVASLRNEATKSVASLRNEATQSADSSGLYILLSHSIKSHCCQYEAHNIFVLGEFQKLVDIRMTLF
mgnify:CR=1 FL=1